MSKPKSPEETLNNLADLLCDEVMAKSDADTLAEAALEHKDVRAHADALRGMVAQRLAESRKSRLQHAQQQLLDARRSQNRPLAAGSLSGLKSIVRDIFEKRSGIPERLTLAYRNGESMSDEDWSSLAEDLADLGFLDSNQE